MTRRRTPVPPHPPLADRDVPADQNGNLFCRRCSLAIVDGDPRHTLPEVPAQAEVLGRYDREGGER